MTRVVSPRFSISYPDATLRDEPADVPGDIKKVVDGVELAARYAQGTLGSRPAASITGRVYYATDAALLYWDTGSAWITIGPPTTDSIQAVHIAADAVGASELADNSVDTNAIQTNAVTSAKIPTDAITATHIAPDSVGASELADNSVDTAAIQANAVTGPKIAGNSISSTHIVADAVGATQISPNAVGSSELADNSVDGASIQNGVITRSKLVIPSAVALRRVTGLFIGASAWQALVWDTLVSQEGNIFWNGSDSFDIFDTGWHQITANIFFDTPGSVGARLLDMSAGGQVVAQSGIFSTGGYASTCSLSFLRYSGAIEYVIQVFSSNGGSIAASGQLPFMAAKVIF